MTRAVRIALIVVVSLTTSCVMRGLRGQRLTGTCEGACDHYLDCRGGARSGEHDACLAECRDVFSDTESLRSFESLSCKDAVEYVDGPVARAHGTG